MTDSVKQISGARGSLAGGSYSGGGFPQDHKKRETVSQQDDLVEISRDARDRAIIKKKKGLLEYLKELFK
ncbi:MAG: hypothetical protein PHY09_00275 [Desulfuromonadaceae bacterium]|nr:hypothetical protein [Desulfuromonadaceae bacterium]MDD5105991.1 hypothetical protein [Desulfuromonadaceae bacterium]